MSDKTGRYYGLVPDFTPREVDMKTPPAPNLLDNEKRKNKMLRERITELESKLEQAEADYKALQIETSEICSELTAENKRLTEKLLKAYVKEGMSITEAQQALQGECKKCHGKGFVMRTGSGGIMHGADVSEECECQQALQGGER